MSEFINVDQATGVYKLQGCFDKFSIPEQWKSLKVLLKDIAPTIIDLKAITECDSALIALLVEIKRQYPSVVIQDIPENIALLLDLYQVKALLH